MVLRRWPALSVLLAIAFVCAAVISRTAFISDLSAFMPRTPSERQRLLLDQLRYGMVARLILVGIENSDASERARLSKALADSLRHDMNLFVAVQNGDAETAERDRAYFFQNRYLLSPGVTRQLFTVKGLHAAFLDSLDVLAGDAGYAFKSIFSRDPTGETLKILERFQGESRPRALDGVWASPDGRRAVLVLQTRAAGSDIEAQSQIVARVQQAFARIPGRDPQARIVMSGSGVLSVASRARIQGEIARLAVASLAVVTCLLLAVYRSPLLFLLGMLPVVVGAVVGITAVSIGFGHVHSLTLGFGTTLIGEAVDYSIYLFIQHVGGSPPLGFWRTIALGVLTSVAGYAALLFSGFPSLAQLGLYSIAGLIAAALTARHLLPPLIPHDTRLRDLRGWATAVERAFTHIRRFRWLALAAVLAGLAIVLSHSGRIWNRQLIALSPVTADQQRVDTQLRADLGVSDMRYVATFFARDEQSALEKAESAGRVLDSLVNRNVIGGYMSPAFALPSLAEQHERQSAIPPPDQARLRVSQTVRGLPIRADRLEGFLSDLRAAQERAPLGRSDIAGTSAESLVESLLVRRESDFLVLMPLRASATSTAGGVIDLDAVASAFRQADLAGIQLIDVLKETTDLFDGYLREALTLVGFGCTVILALLLAALRSVARTLRVVAPLACSVVCVTAVLLACGIQLTILHLVGLLLVVAIGSNYALFFDRASDTHSSDDIHQVRVSLLVANLTAVSSFGLLGLSRVSLLSAIGTTVGLGTFLALGFCVALARKPS